MAAAVVYVLDKKKLQWKKNNSVQKRCNDCLPPQWLSCGGLTISLYSFINWPFYCFFGFVVLTFNATAKDHGLVAGLLSSYLAKHFWTPRLFFQMV